MRSRADMVARPSLAARSLVAFAVVAAMSLTGRAPRAEDKPAPAPAPPAKHQKPGDFAVAPPPFSPGVYPCSDCHNADREPDPTRRELSEHDFKFEHDAEHRWCLDCHDVKNYDKLHLATGVQVDFAESYKLCGQCHGDKYRDWRAGVHGRRTGEWDGKKSYLLCVHCHSPHSPRVRALQPLPPPVRPDQLRRGSGGKATPVPPATLPNSPAKAGNG